MKTKSFILIFLPALLVLVWVTLPCPADTGTYRIQDYRVKLTPKSDGTVEIHYEQTWKVTGGHIPWITVGTPNSSFDIQKKGTSGNVKKIRSTGSGGWSGVRIDLDKDYRSGETFRVGFTLVQHGLFYAKGEKYGMGFTPGWYDRARIDHLLVEVFFYADVKTVSAKPKPSRIEGQSMIWETSSLKRGRRFHVDVSFPKNFLPKGVPVVKRKRTKSGLGWLCFLFFVAIFVLVIFSTIRRVMGGRYGGGHIFYGGAKGSGGKSGGSFLGKIFSGGGGGFGGRGFSCACACAGCACACACAGGGAAGCDRKLIYRCPLCKDCSFREQCPLWVGVKA